MRIKKFKSLLLLIICLPLIFGCSPSSGGGGGGDSNPSGSTTDQLTDITGKYVGISTSSGNSLSTFESPEENSTTVEKNSITVIAIDSNANVYTEFADNEGRFTLSVPINMSYVLSFLKDNKFIGVLAVNNSQVSLSATTDSVDLGNLILVGDKINTTADIKQGKLGDHTSKNIDDIKYDSNTKRVYLPHYLVPRNVSFVVFEKMDNGENKDNAYDIVKYEYPQNKRTFLVKMSNYKYRNIKGQTSYIPDTTEELSFSRDGMKTKRGSVTATFSQNLKKGTPSSVKRSIGESGSVTFEMLKNMTVLNEDFSTVKVELNFGSVEREWYSRGLGKVKYTDNGETINAVYVHRSNGNHLGTLPSELKLDEIENL